MIQESEKEQNEAWCETRESMFLASLKNRLVRKINKTVTENVNLTLDEFKEIMIDKSPVSLWHEHYSTKTPLYYITKMIMPSHGGVYVYAESAADKTPKFKSWDDFYRELRIQGLENILF